MNTIFFKYKFLKSTFVRFSLICLASLFFLIIFILGAYSYFSLKHDNEITAIINDITYTENNASTELTLLESYKDKKSLSTNTKAKLYKAMAEISYMTGNTSLYNEYIASALYYCEQTNDAESVVYLTNKYIGLLYSNGCFEAAEQILKILSNIYDINTFSADLKVSYYLTCADVAQMLGKNDEEPLTKASAFINQMEDNGRRQLSQAKIDLLTARNHIEAQEFEQAKELISKYNEYESFGLDPHQVYVICDFQIPYHEIMAKLQLNEGDIDSACKNIDYYLNACDNYNFRSMKLRMLQYVHDHVSENKIEKYVLIYKQTIDDNLTEMTRQYGNFLLNDINQTNKEKETNAIAHKTIVRDVFYKILFIYICFFVYYIILFIIDYYNSDELTGLYNRRKYQAHLQSLSKKGLYYSLLVLDIDNFKKINDTFGHQCGDEVLQKIGKILQEYNNNHISSFRYGGEELCVFFINIPEYRVRDIADDIRLKINREVSTSQMKVTVSGGIGISFAGEDVFHIADQHLYEAKSNGKNQII